MTRKHVPHWFEGLVFRLPIGGRWIKLNVPPVPWSLEHRVYQDPSSTCCPTTRDWSWATDYEGVNFRVCVCWVTSDVPGTYSCI